MTRSKFLLAIALLALIAAVARPKYAVALQDVPHQREGAGAAQPEPEEATGKLPKKEARNDAEEIRNAPSVKAIARMLGTSNETAYWVSIFLNFAILAVLLGLLLKKVMPATFAARNASIQKRIEDARKTSEEARERLKGVESRLSRLDTEIAEMRREAEENARNEEKRVLAEAEAERQRIVTAAEQEISAVAGNARRELKAYAAELAVDLAGRKIRVGKDADQSLVREFTIQLGKDGN
jgi:F-type H+-transporting ATPase subunit b